MSFLVGLDILLVFFLIPSLSNLFILGWQSLKSILNVNELHV